MVLNLIGIGLEDEKDITIKGLELVKDSDEVYLENYTSKLKCDIKDLEKFYGKKVILADRETVEIKAEDKLLLKDKKVSLLIIGDVFGATTHIDLMQRAKELGVKVNVVHNASILNVVGETGLSLYKFGKVTSIPFENENVVAPLNVLKENKDLHTLLLLDLDPPNNKFMNFVDAVKYLLRVSDGTFNENTFCIGCAGLGRNDRVIQAGKAKDLKKVDVYPQCLIVPGKMHFMEEEFILTTFK